MGIKERVKAQIDGKEIAIEIEPKRNEKETVYETETLPELTDDMDKIMDMAKKAIFKGNEAAERLWEEMDNKDSKISMFDIVALAEKIQKIAKTHMEAAAIKDTLNRGNQGTIHDIIAEEREKLLAIAKQQIQLKEIPIFEKETTNE